MALRLDYEGGDTYIVDANGKRLVKIEGDQSSHHEIAAVFMDAVDAWYPMAKKQIDAVAAQVDGMYLKPTNIYGSMPGSDNTLDYI